MVDKDDINKFLKVIEYNGIKSKVFDFDAIANEGYPINIIISERGEKGKTYGLKEYEYQQAKKKTNDKRTQCLWLRSLSEDAVRECRKFLNDLPPNLKADIDHMSVNVDKSGGSIKHDELGTIFTFSNVSTVGKTKGTREAKLDVVWDEFNESLNTFKNSLIDNISGILSSADNDKDRLNGGKNPMRLWILGNNKGFNHPLLIKLGITYVGSEITRLNAPNGDKLAIVIMPKYDENEVNAIKQRKDHDWLFWAHEQLGTADHIYFNKSTYDDLNSIKHYLEVDGVKAREYLELLKQGSGLFLEATFKIKDEYINYYKVMSSFNKAVEGKSKYHVVHVNSYANYLKRHGIDVDENALLSHDRNGRLLIHTTKVKDVEEGVIKMPTGWVVQTLGQVADDMFSFENETSRILFLESLR